MRFVLILEYSINSFASLSRCFSHFRNGLSVMYLYRQKKAGHAFLTSYLLRAFYVQELNSIRALFHGETQDFTLVPRKWPS